MPRRLVALTKGCWRSGSVKKSVRAASSQPRPNKARTELNPSVVPSTCERLGGGLRTMLPKTAEILRDEMFVIFGPQQFNVQFLSTLEISKAVAVQKPQWYFQVAKIGLPSWWVTTILIETCCIPAVPNIGDLLLGFGGLWGQSLYTGCRADVQNNQPSSRVVTLQLLLFVFSILNCQEQQCTIQVWLGKDSAMTNDSVGMRWLSFKKTVVCNSFCDGLIRLKFCLVSRLIVFGGVQGLNDQPLLKLKVWNSKKGFQGWAGDIIRIT